MQISTECPTDCTPVHSVLHVHSFDQVATNDCVTACDSTSLSTGAVDMCIISLEDKWQKM